MLFCAAALFLRSPSLERVFQDPSFRGLNSKRSARGKEGRRGAYSVPVVRGMVSLGLIDSRDDDAE